MGQADEGTPVVVVRELDRRHFIGGAAVVAAHIRALGARCDLVVQGREALLLWGHDA
jgi:F420-0:gamma-glutamyl ligase